MAEADEAGKQMNAKQLDPWLKKKKAAGISWQQKTRFKTSQKDSQEIMRPNCVPH